MPIQYFTPVNKARRGSKVRGPEHAARVEALGKRMEGFFSADWKTGITRLRRNVSAAKLQSAWEKKNYKGITDVVDWSDLGKYLQPAMTRLGKVISQTSQLTQQALPASIHDRLRLDTKNSAIDDYLQTRTGAMIQNVTENMQVDVQRNIRMAFKDGYSPREVAARLKSHIGLTDQQQVQYDNFAGSAEEKAKLYDRLLNYRAMMISRTEISFAQNQGQLAVWSAAQDQGLIGDDATKVWTVDGSPCPKICDPMDGVEVGLDEDFELPDGVTVPAPPAHPHCRCRLQLNIGGKISSGRDNYKDGADKADDGTSSGRGNDGDNNEGDYDPYDDDS